MRLDGFVRVFVGEPTSERIFRFDPPRTAAGTERESPTARRAASAEDATLARYRERLATIEQEELMSAERSRLRLEVESGRLLAPQAAEGTAEAILERILGDPRAR